MKYLHVLWEYKQVVMQNSFIYSNLILPRSWGYPCLLVPTTTYVSRCATYWQWVFRPQMSHCGLIFFIWSYNSKCVSIKAGLRNHMGIVKFLILNLDTKHGNTPPQKFSQKKRILKWEFKTNLVINLCQSWWEKKKKTYISGVYIEKGLNVKMLFACETSQT